MRFLPIMALSLLCCCFTEGALFAYLDELGKEEACTDYLRLTYFPYAVVEDVLKGYSIPQEERDSIYFDLVAKEAEIFAIVDERTSRIDSKVRMAAAVAIYRQTLYQVFAEVLRKYGIDRREQVSAMLDEIQFKKGRLYKECMRRKGSLEVRL